MVMEETQLCQTRIPRQIRQPILRKPHTSTSNRAFRGMAVRSGFTVFSTIVKHPLPGNVSVYTEAIYTQTQRLADAMSWHELCEKPVFRLPMKTQKSPDTPSSGVAVAKDLLSLEKVRGIFVSLAKFVSAQTIYERNNPNLINSARTFDEAFRSYFANENELVLTVTQYQLVWREQVVYDIGCNTESIAFLLYKDGVGEISIHSQVKKAELEQFVEIIQSELYNPTARFDIVTKLWQAEFANIFYRVLDEQIDGADGDGDGAGSTTREQPLSANDHHNITPAEKPVADVPYADSSIETLGAYFTSLVERACPGPNTSAREQRFQDMLVELYDVRPEELTEWRSASKESGEDDDLISLLRTMIDFTGMRNTPPVIRDITDMIDRLVHYIRDEASVPTLIAALELQRSIVAESLEVGFASLPDRIETEITSSTYLVALARAANKSRNSAHDVLKYLSLVGDEAVAGLCELLAVSTDASIHEKACEALIDLAGDDIVRLVEEFDIENPWLAGDAVTLLSQTSRTDIPTIIHNILSSRDPQIRQCAIAYLVNVATDESAQLLCDLLKDANESVRVKTLVAVEDFRNPLIVDEVTSQCFAEQASFKSPEDLEHMFRTLGKLAGVTVLPRLRQTIAKRAWIPGGKNRNKRSKLLAITALRHIPGDEAQGLLEKLTHDSNNLVKTKALHMLKQRNASTSGDDEFRPSGDAGQELRS